jgi:hypothetical protein
LATNTDKTEKLKYLGHIKRHKGCGKKKKHGRVYTPGNRKRPKRRWVHDITDELQMSASDAAHLAFMI